MRARGNKEACCNFPACLVEKMEARVFTCGLTYNSLTHKDTWITVNTAYTREQV